MVCGPASNNPVCTGRPVSAVRKRFAVSGLLLCGLNLPLVLVANHAAAMAFLVLAFVGIGMFTSNVWAITQTLAGVEASGTWTGLQNAIGNLGGVAAPIVTGLLVGRLGSFQMAFFGASGLLFAAAALYGWMLGSIRPLAWNPAAPPGYGSLDSPIR